MNKQQSMRNIDGFIFYKSYWNAMYDLGDHEIAILIKCICNYAFDEREPELQGELRRLFAAIKPNIDNNINAVITGKKGGAPKGNQNAKKTTKTTGVVFEKQGGLNQLINLKEKEKENKRKENTNSSPAANGESEKVFLQLWKLYPVKRGKSQVSKKSKEAIYKIGFNEMQRAINRYVADLQKEDWRKPQNGSTFFNSGYVDYLDANYEKPQINAGNNNKSKFINFPQRVWDFDELQKKEDERRERERKEREAK